MSTNPSKNSANQYHSVHASAGSGKTYHLVSHMVRLLIQGAEPASILAITFTRKAASEMQERLLERVYELAIAPNDELDNLIESTFNLSANDQHRSCAKNLYESLLHANQGVRTTTFHAFCQDLLRRFPMEADIPPGFELVERTAYLIDEAWNNLENELTRNPSLPIAEHFDVLLTRLGTTETRAVLNKFNAARSEWWALTSQPGFNIEQHCNRLAEKLGIASDENPIKDPIKAYFSDEQNRNELTQFIDLLAKHKTAEHKTSGQSIEEALNDQNDSSVRLEKVWSAFFTKSHSARARKESKALLKSLGADGCQIFLKLHESQCEKLITVRQHIHAVETLSLTRAWLHAGNAFVEKYQKIKYNHRHLDFSDLEWQCFCLLKTSDHADWIQYKLDQRIDHLLIDEFQDTNQTQWQLVLPLLRELAAAKQDRQRSVLFVGDSKQSIYRFRRAEPKLFDAASLWIEKNLDADKQYLSRSYRSSPAIIDFVNHLFEGNETIPLNDFQTHSTVKTRLNGTVELLPLSLKDSKNNKEPLEFRNPLKNPVTTNDSEHLLEAQIAAEKISEVIDSKQIINEGEQARYVDFGDIMILLRNRTHAADYERALREAHIPYMGTERGTLLDSLEIRDMVNLLQWLITPFNNHALAGVLRSPLFSATDQDLYSLVDHPNWFETILDQYPTSAKTSPTDNTPLARAAFHLQNWMECTDTLPVHDLLDRIYSEANVLERYKANYPDHLQSRVQANLTRFIELALENDSGRYPSLTRFLAWLRLLKQQDQEAPDQPAGNSDGNRVRILTIHESKGLESPVVLLLDATTTKRNRGGASVLIDWPLNHDDDSTASHDNQGESYPLEFLISPSSPYPNKHCEVLLDENNKKESQEEANLLYVAVTRAQQYLYISGSGKSAGWHEQICKRYDIAQDKLTQEHLLEMHKGDANKPILKTAPAMPELKFEPRLQQPIQLVTQQIDITPSKLSSEPRSTGKLPAETIFTSIGNRERGILIHQMIELFSTQPNLSLKQFCRKHQLDEQQDYLIQCWQQAEQTIEQFPEYFNEDRYQAAYSEVPVYFKKGETIVNGIIDRLVITENEIVIIDYKTHLIDSNEDLEMLANQFRSQLSLYKEGVALLFPERYPGQSIKTFVIFTALSKRIEITID